MPITNSVLVRLRYHIHFGGPQCKTEIAKPDPTHQGQARWGLEHLGKRAGRTELVPDWSRDGFMALEEIEVGSSQQCRVRE